MTSTCALVVPTKGDRPYLPSLIIAAGCRVVIVATAQSCPDYNVPTVTDLGPPNIQRWWNAGIELAGTDHVGLFNDDVTIPTGLPQAMSARLDETGASICYVATDSPAPCLTGWAFMLNITHGIRPDERFAWYYGDNDLQNQACGLGGVTHVPIDVVHHHPGESTQADPALHALTERDRLTFAAKWGN